MATKNAKQGPIAVGERVKWTSQAAGCAKEKRGVVKAYRGGGRFRATYQVEVEVGNGVQIYTPLAGLLERANPKAKRGPA